MNWKKTEEFYRQEGYIYPEEKTETTPKNQLYMKKKNELLELERWESLVKYKDGKYKQRQGDSTVYPIRKLIQFKRVRIYDGNEYLKSFYELIGVDTVGNQRSTTVQDQEVYMRPAFIKRLIVDRESGEQETRIVDVQENERVYTQKFSPEAVNDYMKDQQERRVSLVVAEETDTGAIAPREIPTIEAFRDRPFDELYYAPFSQQQQGNQLSGKPTKR